MVPFEKGNVAKIRTHETFIDFNKHTGCKVILSIRKTGSYAVNNKSTAIIFNKYSQKVIIGKILKDANLSRSKLMYHQKHLLYCLYRCIAINFNYTNKSRKRNK